MNLLKSFSILVFGLSLYKMKHFSYSRLNEYELNISYRALQYFLNKPVNKQKLCHELFEKTVKALKLPLEGGKLIIDNSTIDKSYSKKLEGASYVWDSRKGRSVYGYSIVHFSWVINGFHIPLLSKIYTPGEVIPGKFTKKGNPKRKKAVQTHSEIACELLSFARNKLKLKPDAVYFDSFFTCKKVLKLLKGYNWKAVFAIRSNLKFEGEKLNKRKWKSSPEWGKLGCGIKVTIMKSGKNYYGTTKFGVSRWWIKKEWGKRWDIEEDFRFLKSELYWECCQSTSKRVQENHFTLGLLSFLVIQLLAKELNLNCYQAKERANLHKRKLKKITTRLMSKEL